MHAQFDHFSLAVSGEQKWGFLKTLYIEGLFSLTVTGDQKWGFLKTLYIEGLFSLAVTGEQKWGFYKWSTLKTCSRLLWLVKRNDAFINDLHWRLVLACYAWWTETRVLWTIYTKDLFSLAMTGEQKWGFYKWSTLKTYSRLLWLVNRNEAFINDLHWRLVLACYDWWTEMRLL